METDRLGMGHKLPRLKSGVPAGGFRRESLCIAHFSFDRDAQLPRDMLAPLRFASDGDQMFSVSSEPSCGTSLRGAGDPV
jgi:hypothetical protein